MITSYDLGFGQMDIYDDYVITIMNEGIIVLPEYNDIFLKIVDKHFKNKAFVYITHRINSYSVDPTIYLETAKINNLVGFAVVSNDPIQKMQTKLEKTFFGKNFCQFNTMQDAIHWKEEIIKKEID
ncbi:hypothetical protein U6A24_20910 [Aquimarina gracilis]|uniref:SpoIIAA-like protein n=1 Tax=Aquimarina gracilis TaxID=874422 RepID=A0ABU6A1D2_9FLAO|nr:hypothetical protein [Aquimarina gracilis]MEB3347948.1 hypothetical protein [Aquimarina gracilis]